jgi:hypothetical protein
MVVEEAVVLKKEPDFGMNSILLAVHNSGKIVHKTFMTLIIAINDPSVQELFEDAGINTSISPSN